MKKRFVLGAFGASALFFVSGFTGASCAIREASPNSSRCFSWIRPNPAQLQYSGLSETLFGLGLNAIDFGAGVVVYQVKSPRPSLSKRIRRLQPIPAALETPSEAWHDYGTTFIDGSATIPLPDQSEM